MDSGTLADKAGISYRQLDHWVRLGLVKGTLPGSGYRRDWPPESVRHVTMMGKLVRAGIMPRKAAELAAQITSAGRAEIAPGLWITEGHRDAAPADGVG